MAKLEIIEPRFFGGELADELVASIQEFIEDKGYCTLVLAGGKTPSSVYRLLSKPPRIHQIDWEKVFVFWGDERWVDASSPASNYKMVNETLISQIDYFPKENIFAINTTLESPQAGARAYSDLIQKFFAEHPASNSCFDLVLLGLGADGHTASLFPGEAVLADQEVLAASVHSPIDQTKRVSLGIGQLTKARRIIFIVTGDAKAEIIRKVLEEENDLPARRFVGLGDKVTWFLDSAAAKNLKNVRE